MVVKFSGLLAEEGCISCKKLYSLIKERCSSYLILDSRPRDDFFESQMKVSNVINIPEEILKPGYVTLYVYIYIFFFPLKVCSILDDFHSHFLKDIPDNKGYCYLFCIYFISVYCVQCV